MSSSVPLQVAETIQTASINRHPSPRRDMNPSTAADKVEPVSLHEEKGLGLDHDELDNKDDEEDQQEKLELGSHDNEIDEDEDEDEDDIPYSVLKPRRRHSQLPPLPDLRFEQSYLHSIAGADTWWKIAWITTRDQVMIPLAQGVLYNLAICGWQFYNKNAQVHGSSVGARVRRWWYGVNNWAIPPEKSRTTTARSPLGGRVWR